MSKDICQRCGAREATVTSEAGRFCSDCDELNDIEQDSAMVQEENAQLRQLVQRAHTLLDDIRQPFKNVELYDVKKWLEDTQPSLKEVPSDKRKIPIRMNLYAALDLSAGNKAVAIVQEKLVVVQRVMAEGEFYWLYSVIHDGKGSDITSFEAFYRLGETLQEEHGINSMEDMVWIPVDWLHRYTT